jgi:hypothetical protein
VASFGTDFKRTRADSGEEESGHSEPRHPVPAEVPDHGARQVLVASVITFMCKLYANEIHGYHAAQGLTLLELDVLATR